MTSATKTMARMAQRRGWRSAGAEATGAGARAVADIRTPGGRTSFATNTVRNEQRSCQVECAVMRVSPRERPARPPLSREAVLEAGLHVLRTRGIEGVTMRAVAAEIETGPASLYVYVTNRKDLLDQMFDLVAGSVDLGPEPDPQRRQGQPLPLLTRGLQGMG